MAKLVDKAKLQELAVGLHGKAKSLVEIGRASCRERV